MTRRLFLFLLPLLYWLGLMKPPTPAPTPQGILGDKLVGFWSADDVTVVSGRVTVWIDQSGNGNHLVATRSHAPTRESE